MHGVPSPFVKWIRGRGDHESGLWY